MSRRTITLGTWEGQPIEWLVLKEESYGTLVISKRKIRNCNFDDNKSNKWNISSLRRYLNGEFFNSAFTDEEKKKIVNVKLTDVATKDDVFLLSEAEVKNLIKNENCFNSWCFTRSASGSSSSSVYLFVDNDMTYGWSGHNVHPAMYIREK